MSLSDTTTNWMLGRFGAWCLGCLVWLANTVPSLAQEPKSNGTEKSSVSSVNPAGTWRWEYDMQGETFKDYVRLEQGTEGKVTGTFHSKIAGETEIKEGKVSDKKLSFTVIFEFQGADVTLKFGGNLDGDAVTQGSVQIESSNGNQEFPWSPKRSVEMEDVVGEWKFHIDAPNGEVYEPTMTIVPEGDKFVAKYLATRDLSMTVQDLRIEKNELMFQVTGQIPEGALKAKFHGRPYGNQIQGRLDFDVSGEVGEASFRGVRKRTEKKGEEPAAAK